MSTRTATAIASLSAIAALTGCGGARAATRSSPPVPPPVTRATLARMIDSMVNAPEFRTALWGVLIVDPEARDTLYAHNAAKLFIPASNQKIVSSAVMPSSSGRSSGSARRSRRTARSRTERSPAANVKNGRAARGTKSLAVVPSPSRLEVFPPGGDERV